MCSCVTVFGTLLVASKPNWWPQVTAASLRRSPQAFRLDSAHAIYETHREVVAWATFGQWFKGLRRKRSREAHHREVRAVRDRQGGAAMEPHDQGGKGLLIAHAICCGGPLLVILLASNAAFLLSLARSGTFWAGTALVLGSVAFFFVRRRRAGRIRPPTLRPHSGQAADVCPECEAHRGSRPPLHSIGGGG